MNEYGLLGSGPPPSLFTVNAPVRSILPYQRRNRALENPDALLTGAERFGQLYAGPYDPRMTPEQNAMARKRALFAAGASMLANAGSGRGTFANLGNALMAGQQVGDQSREHLQQQLQAQEVAAQKQAAAAQQQQLREMIARTPPGHLPQLAQQLVAAGQNDAADSIMRLINAGRRPGLQQVRGPNGITHMVDSETGDIVRSFRGDEELNHIDTGSEIQFYRGSAPLPQNIVTRIKKTPGPSQVAGGGRPQAYTDEDGQLRYGVFNPQTRSFEPVRGASPVSGAGTEDERKAFSFYNLAPRHISTIDEFEGAPGRVAEALTGKGLREFTTGDQQKLNLAGNMLADAYLRMTTGAAYTATELANARSQFIPQPGDTKETLAYKKQNRLDLQKMLQTRSGRLYTTAANGGATGNSGALDVLKKYMNK